MSGSDATNEPVTDSTPRASLEAGHDEGSTTEGGHNEPEQSHAQTDSISKAILDVTNSEIGVKTLLNRLKQSIGSAKVSKSLFI